MELTDASTVTGSGGVTLPAESGQEKAVRELVAFWGADALRDSDGTTLSDEIRRMGPRIYSTICLVRADQEWPKERPDQLHQKFLMSDPVTAVSDGCVIPLLKGYFDRKHRIDTGHDPHRYWQVFDRTEEREVPEKDWSFDPEKGEVTIRNALPFHVYTVNFLSWQTWDPTSMYNHLTNGWKGDPVVSVDPFLEETWNRLMSFFERWLDEHSETDVVRLTTLAYHFTIDSNPDGSDKYRDWTGYTDTVSVEALEAFEREYGYRLRSEDFVDKGYYNATYRVPRPAYLDWMSFIQRFVHRYAGALTERIHAAGKKAAVFWGDHWIGMEPYSEGFQSTGVDIHVGACEDGVALRRCADAPGPQEKEVRFYPYFFPDVFRPGGDPTAESRSNWMKIRRAMLRSPVERIGYGGYLSLAAKFPGFMEHVRGICNEFRTIRDVSGKNRPWSAPVKVGVLTAWGKLRSWFNTTGKAQKFRSGRPDVTIIPGSNLLECLSGLPVEVRFISFDDILANGIDSDLNVVINDGDEGTAWSGGRFWADPRVVSALRRFVHEGGGFIGGRDPSAIERGGRFFQLCDVLGVQKETGRTLERLPEPHRTDPDHFITRDLPETGFDPENEQSWVWAGSPKTKLLFANSDGHVHLAAHDWGEGRSVYLAGLPYSPVHSRLLYRTLLWAAGKEDGLERWFCRDPFVECAFYPETGTVLLANASDEPVETVLHDGDGLPHDVRLSPHELKAMKLKAR